MPTKPSLSFLTRAKTSLDPLRLPRLLCDRLEYGAQQVQARGLTLVSRGLVRYRSFDLSALGAGDRVSALQAQLVAWEPLPDAEYLVSWQGTTAQVFAVERSRLDRAAVKNPQWLPESLARPAMPDGLRLLQGLDGFEGQAWKDGVLRTSRWWSMRPTAQEWSTFLRQAGAAGPAEAVVPDVETAPWQRPARLPTFADRMEQPGQGSESWLTGVLALVLIGFVASSARALWDGHEARRQAQAALAELRAEVAPVLQAREKALAQADGASALIAQLQAPRPLEILEELLRLLPRTGLIRELDMQGMDVRVLLELPADIPRSKVIADLEAGGWFTQVAEARAAQARAGLDLQMKLSAVLPPRQASADTGLQRLSAEGVPTPAASAPAAGVRP